MLVHDSGYAAFCLLRVETFIIYYGISTQWVVLGKIKILLKMLCAITRLFVEIFEYESNELY